MRRCLASSRGIRASPRKTVRLLPLKSLEAELTGVQDIVWVQLSFQPLAIFGVVAGPAEHDVLSPRELPEAAVGDLCIIEAAGAYCSAMSAKHYNSFPEAPEVLLMRDGSLRLIRRRQTLEEMVNNEVPL